MAEVPHLDAPASQADEGERSNAVLEGLHTKRSSHDGGCGEGCRRQIKKAKYTNDVTFPKSVPSTASASTRIPTSATTSNQSGLGGNSCYSYEHVFMLQTAFRQAASAMELMAQNSNEMASSLREGPVLLHGADNSEPFRGRP